MLLGLSNLEIFANRHAQIGQMLYRLEWKKKKTACSFLDSAMIVGYIDDVWDCGDNGWF